MSKSKERINNFGEVFTSHREVNAMLDLVRDESSRIDSRFLEPACGNGNFLCEILNRKIAIVKKKYSQSQTEFERYAFLAVSSLYGVDILEDNVFECRKRIKDLIDLIYTKQFELPNDKFIHSIEFVLLKNILHGDALKLTCSDGITPLVFSEWNFVTRSQIKRIEYTLADLLAYQHSGSTDLFSDLGDEAFIAPVHKIYKLHHFLDLNEAQYEKL